MPVNGAGGSARDNVKGNVKRNDVKTKCCTKPFYVYNQQDTKIYS